MSKQCAICGDKIQMMSEYNLSKDHKNVKICFTCYEYVATAMKGNPEAIKRLKQRYKDDISAKISGFVESMDKKVDFASKKSEHKKDEFMKLMSNDLSKEKNTEKHASSYNIIRLDKLSEAKKDRLIRIKIISSALVFAFLALGLLFSFYLFTQGYGGAIAIVMAIVSIGFSILFAFIKTVLSVILDS
ncbi:MAG: hypothetical protein AB1Z23_10135 [Eubacteriales bacterium]